MTKRLKRAVLLIGAMTVMAIPAAPAHATTCAAADPTVDYVVCQVVYPTAAGATCHVKLFCY